MQSETTKYRLSLYSSRKLIKETPDCRIETVFCSLDEKTYIKRSYPEDKRELFHVLQYLKSTHIPQITEVIFDENTTVIEEYIQGKKLSELIENDQLTPKQAHKLAKQIFEALSTLHDGNIIHRDIKPDNILVDKNDNVWLIDFGIARLYDESARHDTQHLGTIGYAPPEQFGFSQSDFRSDLYAAGVAIEEMGKAAGCFLSSAVMKTAKRCREFDPRRRYTSAKEALRALNRRARAPIFAAAFLCVVAVCIVFHLDIPDGNRIATTDAISASEAKSESQSDGLASQRESPPEEAVGNSDTEWESEWFPIIDTYYADNSVKYGVPANCEAGFIKESLGDNLSDITVHVTWQNRSLVLVLDDHTLPAEEFVFSYEPLWEPAFSDTQVDAELVLYDMDGDGQRELLVAMHDRQIVTPVRTPLRLGNWKAIWCIGYTQGEGFWEADGVLAFRDADGAVPVGNGTPLNYYKERELQSGEATGPKYFTQLNGQTLETKEIY